MKNRSDEPPLFQNRDFLEGLFLLFGKQADKQADKKPQSKPKGKPKEKITKIRESLLGIRGRILGPKPPMHVTYNSFTFGQAYFRSKNA